MKERPEYRPWRDATKLIATATYTRGLWSALFLWRAMSVRPFKSRAVEWGVSESDLRGHLSRALRILLPLTLVELILYWTAVLGASTLIGCLFLIVVALQWTVLPWIASRRLLTRGTAGPRRMPESTCLVAGNEHSPIADLGYLLREARFAVAAGQEGNQKSPAEIAAQLYVSIEEKFSALNTDGVCTQRVHVIAMEDAQPFEWSLYSAVHDLPPKEGVGSDRLLVLGQRPGYDGLAAVEFSARTVKQHLSIEVRTRWLPPLRRRFSRLACLPLQKTWWRGVVVPILLSATILLLGAISQLTAGGLSPGNSASTNTDTLFGGIGAVMADPVRGFLAMIGFGLLLTLAGYLAFLPLAGFFVLFIARAIRLLRGCLYAATGTVMNVAAAPSYRFRAAELTLGDEGALRSGLAYLQIMEQTVMDTIICVLQTHGIDTQSIREEARVLINEGIYMTGGSLQASNIVVGALAKLVARRRQKLARSGHVTFGSERAKKVAA